MRRDIPKGMQAAQLIHAAGESSPGGLPKGTYAVALAARDEAAIRLLAENLKQKGLPHHLIVENDAPYAGQAMAIGIPPMNRVVLHPILRRFQLLK